MLLYGSPRGVNVSGGEWRCVFNTSVFNMAHVRVICFQEGHRFTHLALHIKKEKHTECTVVNQYALAKNEVCYFDSFSLLLLINTESFRERYACYSAQVCSHRLTQNWIPPCSRRAWPKKPFGRGTVSPQPTVQNQERGVDYNTLVVYINRDRLHWAAFSSINGPKTAHPLAR